MGDSPAPQRCKSHRHESVPLIRAPGKDLGSRSRIRLSIGAIPRSDAPGSDAFLCKRPDAHSRV